MKCPACATADLLMTERAGIEIDYCPQCRGVWLYRGELDKILERSAKDLTPSYAAPADRHEQRIDTHQFGNGNHRTDNRHHDGHYQHAKKPFWQELFD